MLSLRTPRHQPSTRNPFRAAVWDDNHPEFRRIDAMLPADHHARWLATVVARLNLAPLSLSYTNRGSQAYLPGLLLPFVLFMSSNAIASPADWAEAAKYDDRAKWLLRGLQPSRSQLYTFRDRLEPYLNDWHAQIVAWAIYEKLTTAQSGSLDGTLIAALGSRHRLLGCRRVDQRLLLLRLLVWCDTNKLKCDPATFLDHFAAWLLLSVEDQPLPPGTPQPPSADALQNVLRLLGPVLDGQVLLPTRMPAWVPATVAGRKRVLERYVHAQERLAERMEPYQRKKRLSKKDKEAIKRMKVSLTDPEAALGWDKVGTYRLLYNLLLVQATDAPLTLGWDVLSCNNDQGLIQTMMEETMKRVGHYLKELLVDGGFLNVSDAVWCEKEGIVIYAPPAKLDAAKAEAAKAAAAKAAAARVAAAKAAAAKVAAAKAAAARTEAEKAASAAAAEAAAAEAAAAKAAADLATAGMAVAEMAKKRKAAAEKAAGQKARAGKKKEEQKQEQLPKSAFRYDAVEKVYYCPEGKQLEPVSHTTMKLKSGVELPLIVHRASGKDCQACPQQAGCTSNPKKGRVVKRYEGEEALERLEQRMADPAAQQIYRLRGQTVELGNADLKEHRGLRVFRSFGLKRARTQAGLAIIASNGIKIMYALQRRQTADSLPISQEKHPAESCAKAG
jgi:transposase